jgi:hypothetical protein
MSSQPIDRLRRARRWLLPVALLALTPKCLLCLAGYFGLGVALGLPLASPELCGGETITSTWTMLLALGGLLCGIAWGALRRRVH